MTDSSGAWRAPELDYGMLFQDYGSYGLRQYGGWVREEYLRELTGQEAARTYREMADNNAVVGTLLFSIMQAIRKVEWRVEPAADSSAAKAEAEFVDTLRNDMSHTWDDFVTECLSMLPFGYSVHEIVYKRRLGPQDVPIPKAKLAPYGQEEQTEPSSKYNDGRIGWRRLPIRGQETVIKWFFDANGQIQGLTQQPWVGTLIDIPVEKVLLFRPMQHKNNPEGRSILRNAYRSYYFIKRLEELEAILFERMGGFPVIKIPSTLIEKATSTNTTDPDVLAARNAYDMYRKIVTRMRINEQMGAVIPSDPYKDPEGKISSVAQYDLQLVTPKGARQTLDTGKVIDRYTLNILMTVLADFVLMGHQIRGTQNLAYIKVDMFYAAVEGWLDSIVEVFNRHALPRLWRMNGLPENLMPRLEPDMPQRLDLEMLGDFIKNIAQAGMPLFPDEELEHYIRDAAGFPDIEGEGDEAVATLPKPQLGQLNRPTLVKMLMGSLAKRIKENRRGA